VVKRSKGWDRVGAAGKRLKGWDSAGATGPPWESIPRGVKKGIRMDSGYDVGCGNISCAGTQGTEQ
jgi:hypothetical protein